MKKHSFRGRVKDQGPLFAKNEGNVAGMKAKGISKMSEYRVSRDPVILDAKNDMVLTPDGERVVLVYFVGNGQIDLGGLRDAAGQAVSYLKSHPDENVRKVNEDVMHEAERIHDLLSQSAVNIVNKIRSYDGDLLEDFTVAGEQVDYHILERVLFLSTMFLIDKVREGSSAIHVIFLIRNWWVSYGIMNHRHDVGDFACMASAWLNVSAGFVLEILQLFDAVA